MSSNVDAALTAALNASLARDLPAPDTPLAVGFSGGGDSTALLYALRSRANNTHVFIVDHGLRAGSGAEALAAKSRAESWGFKAEVLTSYFGPLYSAIQEEARRFRYRLMADAMRRLGINYLLTGHTLDDQAETCLMRYERKTDWRGAAGIAAKAYGPIWPELASITLLRPLLGVSRQDLRAYNRAHNLKWVEDPSNENRQFTRIRARDHLRAAPELRSLLLATAKDMKTGLAQDRADMRLWLDMYAQLSPDGWVILRRVPCVETLMHIIRAVGGSGAMIDRAALRSLKQRLSAPEFNTATLGGALITAHEDGFLVVCDLAGVKGRKGGKPAIAPSALKQGTLIWDGRFRLDYSGAAALSVRPLWGHIDRAAARVKAVPARARPALPLILDAADNIICAGAHESSELTVRWLGGERLEKLL